MKNLILAFVLLGASTGFCQLVGPKASYQENKYDFGELEEGIKVHHSFVIYNSGGDLLIIKKVRASCGCTAAKPEKNKLAPGESTEIKTTFNTVRRTGHQRKHVYVYTNDPDNPEIRFTFTANILRKNNDSAELSNARLKINKYQHNFGLANEGEVLEWDVKLENIGKKELIIRDIKTSCGCTAAVVSNKIIKPGGKGEIKIEFDTSNRTGKLTRTVTVYSNDFKEPRQTITLYVNIQKR